MNGQLLPVDGGDPVPLMRETLRIGRRESCDISFRFPEVPDVLGDLEWTDGYWWISEPMSSPMPPAPRRLLPGDMIDVGGHLYTIDYNPHIVK